MAFNNFPYSDMHELNLDWVIKKCKEAATNALQAITQSENTEDFVNNYFDNLDVQTEINNKMDAMIRSGQFGNIVSEYVPNVVTAWLNSHITQETGYVLDDTLSISGAAADSLAVGNIVYGNLLTQQLSYSANINNQNFWEIGALDAISGAKVTSTERVRSKWYLPTNITDIIADSSIHEHYGFFIYGYDDSFNYLGQLTSDNTFVPDGGNVFDVLHLAEVYNLFPKVRLKMCVVADGLPGIPYPTISFVMTNITLKTGQYNNAGKKLRFMTYNIGRFNWGLDGGLPDNVAEEKIYNMKKMFYDFEPDCVGLQEYTETIDTSETYNTDSTLFDPVFAYKTYTEKMNILFSQFEIYYSKFSYLHVTEEPSAWMIYGKANINGRVYTIASAVLNSSSTVSQHISCLQKMVGILGNNAIVMIDTNSLSDTDTATMKSYMEGQGYTSGNWSYIGTIDTYNLNSAAYKPIDNIFCKGACKIVNAFIVDRYSDLCSDHYPFICDIAFN